MIGSKTTDECGDDWRRVNTTTYNWRRVHRSGYHAADEYIRVPRDQEMSTYDRRRVHTTGDEYIQVHISTQMQDTSTYQWVGCLDQYKKYKCSKTLKTRT